MCTFKQQSQIALHKSRTCTVLIAKLGVHKNLMPSPLCLVQAQHTKRGVNPVLSPGPYTTDGRSTI